MTVGNLTGEARQKPSMRTVMLVGLLPNSAKIKGLKGCKTTERQIRNSIVHRACINELLRSVNEAPNAAYVWKCADGEKRRFYPRISGWIADYPEQRLMAGLLDRRCPWCEVKPNNLGDLPVNYGQHHETERTTEYVYTGEKPRNHVRYAELFHTRGIGQHHVTLAEAGVKVEQNPLWSMLGNVGDVPKPDLLHTIYLGVLKSLLLWLEDFLISHGLYDRYNKLWLEVPPYHELPRPHKTYREVTNWQGKEIRNMAKYLLAVLSAATSVSHRLSKDSKQELEMAADATRALLEFNLYAQYRRHDDDSLRMMRNCLHRFHKNKHVFNKSRLGKLATKRIKNRKAMLMAELESELDGIPDLAEKSATRKRLMEQYHRTCEDIEDEEAHFNLPKLHMLLHFPEIIVRFGSLSPVSTESCEAAHIYTMKDAYKKSSRNGDLHQQLIDYGERHLPFIMREMNNIARENGNKLTCEWRRRQQGIEDFNNSDYGSGRITPLEEAFTHETPPLLQFSGVQDEKIIGGKLCKIRSVNVLNQFISQQLFTCKSVDLLDLLADFFYEHYLLEESNPAERQYIEHGRVTLYNGLRCPVMDFNTEQWVTHTIRATVGLKYYSGPPRCDWAWMRPTDNVAYELDSWNALHGRLPFRVLCLFSINVPELCDEPLQLALGEPTKPLASGNLQGQYAMPHVSIDTIRIISCNQLEGLAHLIPIAVADGDNYKTNVTQYIVNTHIDAMTWNVVWSDTDPDIALPLRRPPVYTKPPHASARRPMRKTTAISESVSTPPPTIYNRRGGGIYTSSRVNTINNRKASASRRPKVL